jgi:hypothetical protein
MFCVSTKLALTWALAGCHFDVIASFGNSHLIRVYA